MSDLRDDKAMSGALVPVFTIEVHPLRFGRYRRNASISARGKETTRPEPNSTTTSHAAAFEAGTTETFPTVELKVLIDRGLDALAQVTDAIFYADHHKEPVVFCMGGLGQPGCLGSAEPQSKSVVEQWPRLTGPAPPGALRVGRFKNARCFI